MHVLNTHSGYVKIDANSCVTCLLTSNFRTSFFFIIYIAVQKIYSTKLKRTSTIKQILIFLEAVVHGCSSK